MFYIVNFSNFRVLYKLLQISPSYELARRFHSGERSKAFLRTCPSDFQDVLETYKKFGNVMDIDEISWATIRPGKHFDRRLTAGALRFLGYLSGEQGRSLISDARSAIVRYTAELEALGYNGQSALLAVRLDASDHALIKEFKRVIRLHPSELRNSWARPIGESGAGFHKKRIHIPKLRMGVELLLERVANSTLPYWRSALKVNFSETFNRRIADTRLSEADRLQACRDYEKIAYRAIKKFERIAEHAARGRFPCDDAIDYLEFDYDGIARRLNAHRRWMAEHPSKSSHLKNVIGPIGYRKLTRGTESEDLVSPVHFSFNEGQLLLF